MAEDHLGRTMDARAAAEAALADVQVVHQQGEVIVLSGKTAGPTLTPLS